MTQDFVIFLDQIGPLFNHSIIILNGWMTEVSSNTFFGACSLRYTCLVPDGRMTSSRGHVSRSRSHFVQQSSQQSGLEVGTLYCTSWGKGTLLYFRHFMFLTDVDTTLQLTLYKGVKEVSRRFWFDQIKRYWYFGVLHTVYHKFYCKAAVHKCISFKNCVQFSLHENKRGVNTLQLPTRRAHAHVSRSNVFQNNLSSPSSPNSFCQSFVIPGVGEKSFNAKKSLSPSMSNCLTMTRYSCLWVIITLWKRMVSPHMVWSQPN